MTEELKVIISASVDQLKQACSEASNSVKDLESKTTGHGEKIKSAFSTIGKGIAVGVAAVATACVAIGKSVWDLSNQVAQYGDAIDKNSQKVGMSAESYQKWDYAMKIAGTSMQDCTAGLKTLTNKFDDAIGGSSSAQETFGRLGISLDDLKGKSREDIFKETVKALQNVESETDKAALANDLFGRSGQNLMPLFNMTEEELNEVMADTEKYGMIMSDKAVAASAQFQDSLTRLQSTIGGVKNAIVGEFLPGISSIMDGLAGMIAGVDGAKETFIQGVTDTVQAVTDAIPTVLELIATLLEGIIEGITACLPNLFTVVTNTLANVVNILVQELPNIIGVVIDGITSLINALSASLPSILTAVVTALVLIIKTIVDKLPEFLESFLTLFSSCVDAIFEALPIIIEALPEIITGIVEFLLAAIPQLIDAGVQLLTALVENLPVIIDTIVAVLPQIITGIINALLENLPLIIQAGVDLLVALVQNMPAIITTVVKAIPQIVSSLVNAIANNMPAIMQAGVALLISLVKNLPTIIATVVRAIPQIIQALVSAIGQGISAMASAGLNLIKGLFNGISNAVGWLYGMLRGWVSNVISYIKGLFGIHSPSRVFATVGDFLVQGLGEGIEDNTHYATDAIEDMSKEVENAFNPALEVPDVNTPDVDINGVERIKQQVELDSNGKWVDILVDRLTQNKTPIQLVVGEKVLAETTIDSINALTLQTGRLGLVLGR